VEASAGLLAPTADTRERLVAWVVLVAIPLAGLVLETRLG
jgi:hypothetical protein